MKLVVGLGNPGRKYEGTRHNIGFDVLNRLTQRLGGARPKAAFQGETTTVELGGQKTLLLWPHTYMNLSGTSVLAARDFYKVNDDDVLLVCDDINLPLAKLRFRADGSAGGQKGLDDVLRRLGTQRISRLRIGVGSPPERMDAADYVLAKFRKDEVSLAEDSIERAADAVGTWAEHGIQHCMNQYNG